MAFPVEASATGAGENAGTTTHVCNLPSSIASGNLLVLVFHVVGNTTITTPTGWTSVLNTADTTTQRTAIFYRIADGTEGSTVSVTTSASLRCEYRSLRFTGAHASTAPEASAAAYASSNAPDPPSLDPAGWGTEDTLWYAIEAGNDATKTVNTYPTNYTGGVQHVSTGGTPGQLALASRNLNAASADPGAFALSSGGGSRTVGITLAIRPGAAAQTLIPTAIASTAALGSNTLKGLMTLLPGSRASGLVLGSHVLQALNTLVPTARASSLQIGSPQLNLLNTLTPEGYVSNRAAYDRMTDTTGTRLAAHTMDIGSGWNEVAGEWEIVSNKLHLLTNVFENLATTEAGVADVTVTTIIAPPTGLNMDMGLVANLVDYNNYWMIQIYSGGTSFWEKNGGSWTQQLPGQGTSFFSSSDPTEVSLVTRDNTIDLYIAGSLVATYTGTPRTTKTGTKFGVLVRDTDQGTTFDNFQIKVDKLGLPSIIHLDTLLPNGRGSSLALGDHTLHTFNALVPSSIASTLSVGSPTLKGFYTIIPNGVVSTAQLGEHMLSSQVVDVLGPTGRASSIQLGNHTLHTFNTLQPSGRASGIQLGGHTLKGLYTLQPNGRASTLNLGSHRISSTILLLPNGVPSLASVGSPSISGVFVIAPTGRPSSLILGLHRLSAPTILIPNGIPSTSILGLPRIFQILFPSVCEPLELIIERTTPTGLDIVSGGLTTIEVVHVAESVLEVIKNDTELDLGLTTISLLEVVCDGG